MMQTMAKVSLTGDVRKTIGASLLTGTYY